jgi:Tfp pilus assembly protein PilF
MAINRNDPCPCGSGKKYKSCCMRKPGGAPGRAPGARKAPPKPAAGRADQLRTAAAHVKAGRLDAAEAIYASVLERKPKEAHALLGLGQICEQRGRYEQAAQLLQRAVDADARCRTPAHLMRLAVLYDKSADADRTLRAAKRVLAMEPGNASAHCFAAMAYERLNRLDEALESAERSHRIDPEGPAVLVLGRLMRRAKRFDEARALLETFLARPHPAETTWAATYQELAMVLDGLGDHDAAYEAFVQSGREIERTPEAKATDREIPLRRLAGYDATITRELLERWRDAQPDDGLPRPHLVAGFPRSGTTMAEQILGAHPNIVTSDEKPFLAMVGDELDRVVPGEWDASEKLAHVDADQVRRLRQVYWEQAGMLFSRKEIAERVVVDKNPLNLMHLGLVNVVFPEAKVIVLVRDPRDACLSCFTQHFRVNPAMIHFTTLAGTVDFYTAVMGFWLRLREQLTLDVLEIKYEDIVQDLEPHARQMLDRLDVEWDDAVLRFHERAHGRLISTPSYEAVTETVHARRIERWRKYERKFAPFLDRLQPFVEALGYA